MCWRWTEGIRHGERKVLVRKVLVNVPLTPVRFLRRATEQFPGNTAVVCGQERFTYAEFGERVGRLAGVLDEIGIQPGDRVAFLSTNCHRLLEAYYGVLEAGGVLLPLNIRLSTEELSYILNHSEARWLFLQEEFLSLAETLRSKAAALQSCVLLDGTPRVNWLARHNYEDLLEKATPRRREIMEFDENELAELFYTSGSTADPKGVMLTHRNVYLHGVYVALALGQSERSVQLHTIPLFHANGWGQAHSITLMGATHVMIPRFDPVEVFRLVEKERIKGMNMVPTMATALVNASERSRYDLTSLERIALGGAASSPTLIRELEEKFGCLCHAAYGLTETSPMLSLGEIRKGVAGDREDRYTRQAMAGYAIPGVEMRVVDQEGHPLPADGKSVGEVAARGDVIMAGYWRRPEEPENTIRNGWFLTGDMGVQDPENCIQIVDRKKDIIVSGGENVSSLEVERVLAAHPGVYEVAVIPVPDAKWGEVAKALVVLRPDSRATECELIEFTRSRLAHYKAPKSVEFYDSLPKGGTGKILKKELRKRYWPNPASHRVSTQQ